MNASNRDHVAAIGNGLTQTKQGTIGKCESGRQNEESGPDGNISHTYGQGLISESGSKFDYFYHYDGLGSVIELSNASGKPSAAYAYDPWGNQLLNVSDSVGTKNKFRFTGEALDPGTQLYYLRARYYDPSIGRFTTSDPFAGFTTIPLSLNRFVYCQNTPVLCQDPSGLFFSFWGVARLVGGIAEVGIGGVATVTPLAP